jgi:hypothetical protein
VDRFISGLKDNIKHTVLCQKPDTLLSAYWYSRQYEKSYLSSARRSFPLPIATTKAPPGREIRNREPNGRPREPRKCWYCPDIWVAGHKCQPMKRALYAIQMQGNSEDEESEEIIQVQEPPQTDTENLVSQDKVVDNLMHISVSAYTGSPSESTISLLLKLKGAPAIALADTGSTNTFLDYKYAIKHNISMQPTTARTVTVAGGGTLVSEVVAKNCQFQIEGQTFQADFRILKLQGSDIILGVNWFKSYNPVTFDFVDRKLSLAKDGITHTFHDHLVPKENLIISAEECAKLLDHGAAGYLLQSPTELDTCPSKLPQNNNTNASVDILQEFEDIFSPPTGLPPHRESDHKIPLLPGATPPNIRPYRMSHSQKNTIEAIINEMLQNKEIQHSCSPFSSPVILVKKDKSWRLCVDYRSLNDLTI